MILIDEIAALRFLLVPRSFGWAVACNRNVLFCLMMCPAGGAVPVSGTLHPPAWAIWILSLCIVQEIPSNQSACAALPRGKRHTQNHFTHFLPNSEPAFSGAGAVVGIVRAFCRLFYGYLREAGFRRRCRPAVQRACIKRKRGGEHSLLTAPSCIRDYISCPGSFNFTFGGKSASNFSASFSSIKYPSGSL